MGDSCYNHKRGMIVVLILIAIGIATYLYINISKNDSLTRKNRSLGMDPVTYDFDGTWTVLDYSNKQIPIPLKDANDSLVIVSGALNKSFDIHLDFQDKRNSCVIHPNLTYNSVSDHDAYILGDGRVIVSLKNSLVSRENVLTAAFNVQWKIFVIDPKNCSHHNLTVIKGDNLERVVTILPYHDTFDVVMDNDKGALPKVKIVRYDNHSSVIKDFSSPAQYDGSQRIHMIKANDVSGGYYYISPHPANASLSIFKKLNDKFAEVHSFNFSHGGYDSDSFFSLNHGRFSICSYDSYERKNLTCQTLDAETFKTLVTAHLHSKDSIYFVTVNNLPSGGVMVFFAKRNADLSFNVYVQHISSAGKVENPVEIGHVEKLQYIYPFEIKNGSILVAISTTKSLMTKLIVAKKS